MLEGRCRGTACRTGAGLHLLGFKCLRKAAPVEECEEEMKDDDPIEAAGPFAFTNLQRGRGGKSRGQGGRAGLAPLYWI